MGVFGLFAAGLREALARPRLVLVLWLVNVVVALPLAVVVGGSLESSLGSSEMAEKLTQGYDDTWFSEYGAVARGLEKSFKPTLAGLGAFFDNLDAWWSGNLFTDFPALVGVGVLYALLWVLLSGGVLHLLVFGAEGKGSTAGLFAHGGTYFPRFLRLTAISAVGYYGIYKLARWVFDQLEELHRETTVEQTVFVQVLAVAAVTVLLLLALRAVVDFAKIAMVVDGRRGAFAAMWGGLGFLRRNVFAALGLPLLFAALALALLALYGTLAPIAGPTTWAGLTAAFLLGQLAIVTRQTLRLGLLAAELELYRGRR